MNASHMPGHSSTGSACQSQTSTSHALISHVFVLTLFPTQPVVRQERVLVFVPDPHVTLHSDHGPHFPHLGRLVGCGIVGSIVGSKDGKLARCMVGSIVGSKDGTLAS